MKKVICTLLVTAFIAVPAMADPYGTADVSYGGRYRTEIVTIDDGGLGSPLRVYAGLYNLTITNAVEMDGVTPLEFGTIGVLDSDIGLCIDILDRANSTPHLYDVVPLAEAPEWGPMGVGRAQQVANMLDAHWTKNITSEQAAALQVAVWEVVNESGATYDVASGDFKVTAYAGGNYDAFAGLANTYLASVDTAGNGWYVGLTNPSGTLPDDPKFTEGAYQDYLVRVPVPGAALLGFLGLGAAGAKLRRRRRA